MVRAKDTQGNRSDHSAVSIRNSAKCSMMNLASCTGTGSVSFCLSFEQRSSIGRTGWLTGWPSLRPTDILRTTWFLSMHHSLCYYYWRLRLCVYQRKWHTRTRRWRWRWTSGLGNGYETWYIELADGWMIVRLGAASCHIIHIYKLNVHVHDNSFAHYLYSPTMVLLFCSRNCSKILLSFEYEYETLFGTNIGRTNKKTEPNLLHMQRKLKILIIGDGNEMLHEENQPVPS